MPIYPYKCDCGHTEDIYRSVADYKKDLPECCGKIMQRVFTPLMVIGDSEAFKSPIDGSEVRGRHAIREHEKRHDVVQCGDDKLPQRKEAIKTGDVRKDIAEAIYRVEGI